MKRPHLSLAFIIAATFAMAVAPRARADAPTEAPLQQTQTARRHIGLTLAYFGDTIAHPGILAAAEYPVGGAGGAYELLARGYLGGYFHPRLYVGVFTGGELAFRATAGFGLRGEVAAGMAYLHTFLASSVYELGQDGQVSSPADWGRPRFMPSASLGVGWDFGRHGGWPIAVMLRSQVSVAYPYNTSWLIHFAAILGMTYEL